MILTKHPYRIAFVLSVLMFTTSRSAAADDTTTDVKTLQKEVRALRDDVRRLSELLEKRMAPGLQPSPANPDQADILTADRVKPPQTEIQAALLKSVSLDFTDTPLLEVIRKIKGLTDVNVVIDIDSLEEAGVTEKHPVSIVVSDISARSALKLILQPLQLTFIEGDEVLKIVSFQRAKGEMTAVIYPIDDLIESLSVDGGTPSSGNSKSAAKLIVGRMEEIRDLIKKTISPQSWEEVGSVGTIMIRETSCSLVVRQTMDVHDEIDELLQQIRRLKRLPKRKRIPIQTRDDHTRTLVTKSYAVADLIVPMPDGPGARTKVITSDWLKLVDLIIKEVEPGNWMSNGGPCSIQTFESTMSLVIRATHKMHEAIANLLSEMRREQDLQIVIAFNYLKITDNEILYKAGIKFDFDPDTGISRLDESDGKLLFTAVQSGKGDSESAPKITIFNGQIASISGLANQFDSGLPNQSGVQLGHPIHVRGTVSDDRRSVRLNVALSSKNLVNDLINKSYRLDDGGYLLLDLTDGTPGPRSDSHPPAKSDLDTTSPFATDPTKRRLVRNLILIQPRIIIEEEEEMKLINSKRETESK
jgi:hypothetical protein